MPAKIVFLLIGLYQSGILLAKNPGAQIRLSQRGIQYAGEILVRELSGKVVGQRLPDKRGTADTPVGDVEYEVKDMTVTGFNPPKFLAKVNQGQSISISLDGASLSIHGNWHYKIRILFPISDSGSIDVSLNGISITETVVLGEKDGRPSISSLGCGCQISSVDIDIHTGLAWLYNLFKHDLENMIRNAIQGTMCDLVQREINEDAERALANIKIAVPIINDDTILNYGLVMPPKFGPDYIDAFLNGEVLIKGDTPGESGLDPAPFNATQDASHMVYIWLSDYILNTLGYSLQKHADLTFNLTKQDLPQNFQHVLNISCDDSSLETKCIGSAVPQLRKIPKYMNRSLVIGMWSTKSPMLEIIPDALTGVFQGNMAFFVLMPDSSPSYVFTINITERFVLKAALKDNLVTASIVKSKIKVDMLDSHIGKITDAGLQFIFETINTQFIKGELNKMGEKGFQLPKIEKFSYVNPQFELHQDSLVLKTDVAYLI